MPDKNCCWVVESSRRKKEQSSYACFISGVRTASISVMKSA